MTAKEVGDNGYLFENFLGSGQDITFTVDRTKGTVDIEGGFSYYYGDCWYLTTSDYRWQPVYPNNIPLYMFYLYTGGGAQYTNWSETNKTFQLAAYFGIEGETDDNNPYFDYMYITLNE